MWRNLLDWLLNIVEHIGDFYSWLLTPVNINVLANTTSQNIREMNEAGLSNWPTWLTDLFASSTQPIYVTPINVIGVSTLTFLVAIFFIKKIVK